MLHKLMAYSMGGEPLRSRHVVSGLPLESHSDGSFMLVDTPDLIVPKCNAACEPIELDLEVEVNMESRKGAVMEIQGLEAQLEFGVEWATCARDFRPR